jgi:hypothetical protein
MGDRPVLSGRGISFTEEEIAAVESGIEFMNQLRRRLTDVPTDA